MSRRLNTHADEDRERAAMVATDQICAPPAVDPEDAEHPAVREALARFKATSTFRDKCLRGGMSWSEAEPAVRAFHDQFPTPVLDRLRANRAS